jgi:uncharacterized protein YciI
VIVSSETPEGRLNGMAQRLFSAEVVLHADGGHGYLFQHSDNFSQEVLDFLAEAGHSLPWLAHSHILREDTLMYFFATGHVTSPDKIGPFLEEEKRVLSELRQQGLVREAFTPVGGHGVISILEAPSLQEAREQMNRLPFVAHGLMTFDYTEIAEL